MMKSLKIKLKLNNDQKIIINDWINTSNYVYNKTVEFINTKNEYPNFQNLRDKFVTNNTKKNNIEYITFSNKIKELQKYKKTLKLKDDIDKTTDKIKQLNNELRTLAKDLQYEKNSNVNEWELKTPKEVRAEAIKDACTSYKSGISNLKAGNIKIFKLGYRKHNKNNKCISIPKNYLNIVKNNLKIAPSFFNKNCNIKIGNRTLKKNKNLKIEFDCKLIKTNNEYYLIIPIEINNDNKTDITTCCGIDPGVRTFMTTFSNNSSNEYIHNKELLLKINMKIDLLKSKRLKFLNKRKSLNKYEKKKSNLIKELHCKTINHLLDNNDMLFYGDIKSHNIVKNKNNSTLNRDFNDLKFYKFKERLLFKAKIKNKIVFNVNESFTTQTCSCCGIINNVGASKIYNCNNCKKNMLRDENAAKNILIKGLLNLL